MKIYTKTGDAGTTSLFGGKRVSKANPRIESYGQIDELNSQIGVCVAMAGAEERYADVARQLTLIQHQLFALGSHLATPNEAAREHLPPLRESWVSELEGWIDVMEGTLPTLTSFILPGGSILASQVHVARTVCRRAERAVVACGEDESVDPVIQQYLNRLSDTLFVCSRYVNTLADISDTPWVKE